MKLKLSRWLVLDAFQDEDDDLERRRRDWDAMVQLARGDPNL
jgi:hypothetical protein